jgi:hypothetical protein
MIQQATVIQAAGNVIAGDVFVGRFARLRDRWLDPAPVFADAQVERFTGREWLIEPLDRFFAARDRGHVIVQADAGLGKTALAAWLAYSRGWPCHFTRGSNGSIGSVALSNLGAPLIARYRLGDQFAPRGVLPETAGEPGWFEQVLRAAAEAARADGGRVVIVVDGLDEAEMLRGALPLGLPVLLPRGAFTVATCRTGTDLAALRQPYKLLDIKPGNRHNASDLGRFLHSVLVEDAELAALLPAAGVTADVVAARLLSRCGGVWIYLRYVLSELRDGARSVNDIDSLPGDLSAYYAESLLAGRDDPEWGQLRLALLATLAAAGEPLPVPALTRLAGLPHPHPVQVLCDGPFLPFLAVTRGERDGHSRYSAYQASLREFLGGSGPAALAGGRGQAEELARAVVDAHARIADYYLAEFGRLDQRLPALAADPSIAQRDDGYALRHLAEHLEHAGRTEDIHALLACQRPESVRGSIWYAAHECAGALGEYRADLDRARRHAAARTDHDVRRGRQAHGLAVELRYLMIDSAVRTLTTSVPTELVGRLMQSGLWSPARGLFYARQSGDPADRAAALATLLPHLPEDETQAITQEAMSAARQVSSPYWPAWALSVLADDLPDTTVTEAATEALAATAEVTDDDDRAQLLVWLAQQLPSTLLSEAARLGLAIADESERARALLALIPKFPENALPDMLAASLKVTDSSLRGQMIVALASRGVGAMADDLAAAARAVPADDVRAWALGAAASATSTLSPGLAGEALAVARAIADPADRAEALSLLNHMFEDWPTDDLLDEALSAARSAEDEDDRFWALTIVAQYLPSSRRRLVLNEVLKDTLACPPGSGQTDRLAFLAPHLTKAQLAKAVPAVLPSSPRRTEQACSCPTRPSCRISSVSPSCDPQVKYATSHGAGTSSRR